MRTRSRAARIIAGAALALALPTFFFAPRAAAGGGGGPADDGVPAGMIAYFSGTQCPEGWSISVESQGRIAIGVIDGDLVGVQVGEPLGDREDRTHTHTWTGEAALTPRNVAGADGSNNQGAAAMTYTVSGETTPSPSGAGFVQALACKKNAVSQ